MCVCASVCVWVCVCKISPLLFLTLVIKRINANEKNKQITFFWCKLQNQSLMILSSRAYSRKENILIVAMGRYLNLGSVVCNWLNNTSKLLWNFSTSPSYPHQTHSFPLASWCLEFHIQELICSWSFPENSFFPTGEIKRILRVEQGQKELIPPWR